MPPAKKRRVTEPVTVDTPPTMRLPQPRPGSKYGETVSVIVGEGDTECAFTVHKEILRKSASFFDAMMSERWTSSSPEEPNILRLPDDDPEVFDAYLSCIYSRVLPDPPDLKDEKTGKPVYNHKLWIQLYIFADKINLVSLKNKIVLRLYAIQPLILSMTPADLDFAFSQTPIRSKIRNLIAATWANGMCDTAVSQNLVRTAPDFTSHLLLLLTRIRVPGKSRFNMQENQYLESEVPPPPVSGDES